MEVRYNRTVSIAFLLVGALGLVLFPLLTAYTFAGTSVVVLVWGVLMLTRTYFVYEPDTSTIVVKAPIGSLATRHRGPFRVEKGRLRYTRDSRRRTVPVMRVLSSPEDWRAFRAQPKKHDTSPPAPR